MAMNPEEQPKGSQRVQTFTTNGCDRCTEFFALYRAAPDLISKMDVDEHFTHLREDHGMRPFDPDSAT